MREIALELQLSATTVSLALRNSPLVALATRERVQDCARQKGYLLNPFVSTLMSRVREGRRARYQETLGWLNLWEREDQFTTAEYHRQVWGGASERASELGYRIDSFWLREPKMTQPRLQSILKARGIRGLLIPPLPVSCGHITLNWKEFSTIALSYSVTRPRLHRIVPDHYGNMQMILRNLLRRGYQRPGLLLEEHYDERGEKRLSAAFSLFQQRLAARDRVPVLVCPTEGHAPACKRWLKKYRPDCVITQGIFRHVRELEIGDPDYSKGLGVVLVGFAHTDAGFAAISENPTQIGAMGVNHLAALINRQERGLPSLPHTLSIPGTWVEGPTLRRSRGVRGSHA